MDAIKTPGFTAENALYDTCKYNMPSSTTERSSSGVEPQAPVGPGITIGPEQCEWRCLWRCTRYGCFPTHCYQVCF